MSYSAAQLITRAYYTSGFISRRLETVDGEDMTDGFELLNELLAEKTCDISLIPFYKEYVFTAEIGEEKYFVPNLLTVETFTFNINNVRFGTANVARKQYFGSSRVDGISILPGNWHTERALEIIEGVGTSGSNIYLYPSPNGTYALKIWGKFGLDQLSSLDDDLSLVYEPVYLLYLRYALADLICTENGVIFQPEATQKLQQLQKQLAYTSPVDLTTSISSTLSSQNYISWEVANLSNGWLPSGWSL